MRKDDVSEGQAFSKFVDAEYISMMKTESPKGTGPLLTLNVNNGTIPTPNYHFLFTFMGVNYYADLLTTVKARRELNNYIQEKADLDSGGYMYNVNDSSDIINVDAYATDGPGVDERTSTLYHPYAYLIDGLLQWTGESVSFSDFLTHTGFNNDKITLVVIAYKAVIKKFWLWGGSSWTPWLDAVEDNTIKKNDFIGLVPNHAYSGGGSFTYSTEHMAPKTYISLKNYYTKER